MAKRQASRTTVSGTGPGGTNTNAGLDRAAVEAAMQPGTYSDDPTDRFGTAEIWWWKNGVWGNAGYAIPNDGGKPVTGNDLLHGIHQFIGAELFNLMHRPDVQFSRPPNVNWLYDVHKMCKVGIKRMNDYAVGWTDDRMGDAEHSTNTPKAFIVYPVPFFGDRIRQASARRWTTWVLLLLSEIMQHSDNDYHDDITNILAAKVQQVLRRLQGDLAMKFLGFTREQVEDPAFTIPDEAFNAYDPNELFTSREMIEERRPNQWWPQTNDLTKISGIDAATAAMFAERWPQVANFDGDGGAYESAFPGSYIPMPGSRRK